MENSDGENNNLDKDNENGERTGRIALSFAIIGTVIAITGMVFVFKHSFKKIEEPVKKVSKIQKTKPQKPPKLSIVKKKLNSIPKKKKVSFLRKLRQKCNENTNSKRANCILQQLGSGRHKDQFQVLKWAHLEWCKLNIDQRGAPEICPNIAISYVKLWKNECIKEGNKGADSILRCLLVKITIEMKDPSSQHLLNTFAKLSFCHPNIPNSSRSSKVQCKKSQSISVIIESRAYKQIVLPIATDCAQGSGKDLGVDDRRMMKCVREKLEALNLHPELLVKLLEERYKIYCTAKGKGGVYDPKACLRERGQIALISKKIETNHNKHIEKIWPKLYLPDSKSKKLSKKRGWSK
jgi:hypothetical protein